MEHEKEKEQDKTSHSGAVAVFDLQSVLPCPTAQSSKFYYVSKLSVFNLTVFDLKSNEVQCFVWHEGEANRGANEIGTCLMRYFNFLSDKYKTNGDQEEDELEIVLFSDNCAGQQKK
ncbi:hypothetical protein NQ314_001155 [Rhamnusium bicolor]|uniref:Uncharacterized protein n=1 Tax=Rhamnusium bicolor TaxID=1586634 RepID=A0AAV8ZVB6_9CUCU|nr:hypothetical protein NQ314_001155 [Rhamnusium bicolor]